MSKILRLDEIKKIEALNDHASRVHAAAVYYASIGFYLVPIEVNGKGLPPKRTGINYQSASRKKSTIDNWFGEKGKFRGWNVGIACGKEDGVFAVDIDTESKKGISGFESLAALEEEHGELLGPVAHTPKGGKHILFNWDIDCSPSTDKLGGGVDTRGGDVDSCRSHIVAWPSIVNGKCYEWELGGELTLPPEWIPEKLGQTWKAKQGGGRGNEEMDAEDFEGRYSPAQLESMLKYIDPNDLDYEEWVNVGMAVQSQQDNAAGLELWDSWSQQGDRYQTGECTVRWNAFNGEGTVRIGTLIHYAKDGGYDPRRANVVEVQQHEGDEFDQLLAEFNKQYAILVMGGSVKVASIKHDDDPMVEKYRFHSVFDFKTMTGNQTIAIEVKGKAKVMLKADIWLSSPERRQYMDGLQFKPGYPAEFGEALNSWDGWTYEGQSGGSWGLFKDHILTIMCNGDEDHYEWVMDWMADAIQDPMNPKGAAIVMNGVEGCGKGTFSNILGKLFGRHYIAVQDEEHLVGKFNSHMEQTIVVFADEVTYGGSKKVAGKLKALVTEKMLGLERKGIDTTKYHNCAHLIVASNEDWFIPAGPQSRRWFVIELSDAVANNRKYFTDIHEQMNNGGYEAMMLELETRKITQNLSKAPETAKLIDQRGRASMSGTINEWWYENLTAEAIEAPSEAEFGEEEEGWPTRVNKGLMRNAYIDWAKARNKKEESAIAFNKKMDDFGCKEVRAPVNKSGKRPRVWDLLSIDDSIARFKHATGVEV